MKKLIMKASLVAVLGLSMASCKSYYYQVYDVSSNNTKMQDNSLVYENEDCKVLYNLWSNNGKLRFAILNKTDKDIFVNMGQSFYVVNGQAIDYYQGRTYSSQSFDELTFVGSSANGNASAKGFWGDGIYYEDANAFVSAKGIKTLRAVANSVTSKEKEIICIPAKCYKVFNYYQVNPELKRTCDKSKDYPNTTYQVETYTQYSTPMSFKNRIAYGFTKNEVADKHIDNDFWISGITNYSQKAATENYKDKTECYGIKSSEKGKRFKIGTPSKFYKLYTDDGVGGYGIYSK